MKLLLKDFQDVAVGRLVRALRAAGRESKSGEHQSVSLSSPTGSGKTVMMTSAIEAILKGDEAEAPVPDACFLWITDQPELNEQTRKKMLATSSVLDSESLFVLDASFDSETLRGGTVHFLNTQKIGRDKGLVTQGDKRTYSFWEIIKNTIDARPGRFFVIVDEAHRGMTEENGQAEATTIIQKFIKGSSGEIPPMPVIVGISATPERFDRLISGTNRTKRPVDIDVADVRASGLIKDRIVLHHPKREQPSDMTMLREAAKSLKRITTQWATYCAANEDETVAPLLVVQVEDAASRDQISETDIPEAIRLLRNVLGTLPNSAIAHSFQEGNTITVGGESIRYLAPSDVEADPDVRVIFFKTSLNTGWDCPRAEVMMSFRAAADATSIAQLVGRMVRTPLARRIVQDDVLNSVSLYLPHYDAKALEKIITKLSKPDDGAAPIDVEDGNELVELTRAEGTSDLFRALSQLPSYIIPRKRKTSQIRRLMKLGRLLTNHDLDDGALADAKQALLKVLASEYTRVSTTDRFKEIVSQRGKIEIDAVNWEIGSDVGRQGDSTQVDISQENIDDLFEATGRKLHEGLHKTWWRERVAEKAAERDIAKLELFALCIDPEVMRKLERTAQDTVQDLLKTHHATISKLDENARAAFDEVWNLAAVPELTHLVFPLTIHARDGEQPWKLHAYVDAKAQFRADLDSKPEREVLEEELDRPGVVGWLRNTARKPWALCVDYTADGDARAMYPDFLIVREEGKGKNKRLVVDILEPHSIAWADAPAKAAGLAQFAAKHAHQFGRIEFVVLDGKVAHRLDLANEAVRNRVKTVKRTDELRALLTT